MINQVRQNSVINMLYKYDHEPAHAEQVTKLSLIIFDKTKGMLHEFSQNERDLLEAGALLHDIGYYIGAQGHNKNSKKIIKHNGLAGFSKDEVRAIAKIARFHRGRLPEKPDFTTNKLAAMVRVADALDRTHYSVVDDIEFQRDSGLTFLLKLRTPDCRFEILKAQDKKDLFEREFGLELKFKIA